MPCRDYESDVTYSSTQYDQATNDLKTKLDNVTKLLCALSGVVEKDGLLDMMPHMNRLWWENHKLEDKREAERKQREEERKRIAAQNEVDRLSELLQQAHARLTNLQNGQK